MNPTRVIGGRYVVLGELGRGGMGVVWLAEDRVLGRQVAVKELRLPDGLSAAEHAQFRERLLREARTAGRLNHPGIVTVHDVVADNGIDHIVMELIEARTLAEVVAANGPLDEGAAAEVGRQVLAALRRAHEGGVVHRDVKPSNVMLGNDGRVTLTDFGIAQAADDPRLTTTGSVVGSPGYMAPERLAGADAAPAADLWALGATLYHAVEGTGPFDRESTPATVYAVANTDPPPTRCRGPLGAVIAGLLIRSPQARLTAEQAQVQLAIPTAHPTGPATAATTPFRGSTAQVGATAHAGGLAPAGGRGRTVKIAAIVGAVAALVGLGLGVLAGTTLLGGDGARPVKVLTYGKGGDLPEFAISYPTCLDAQLVAGRVVSSNASVSCESPHDLELYANLSAFDSSTELAYPGVEGLTRYATAACAMVFDSAVITGPDKATLVVSGLIPAADTFTAPDSGTRSRDVFCVLGRADGAQLTGTRISGSS